MCIRFGVWSVEGNSGLGGSSHEDVSVVLRILQQDSHVKLNGWASSVSVFPSVFLAVFMGTRMLTRRTDLLEKTLMLGKIEGRVRMG